MPRKKKKAGDNGNADVVKRSEEEERWRQWMSGRHPLGNGRKGWQIKHK